MASSHPPSTSVSAPSLQLAASNLTNESSSDQCAEAASHDSLDKTCHIHKLPYDVLHVIFVALWTKAAGAEAIARGWAQAPGLSSYPTSAGSGGNTFSRHRSLGHESQFTRLSCEWLLRLNGASFDSYISPESFKSAAVKYAGNIIRLITPYIFYLQFLHIGQAPMQKRGVERSDGSSDTNPSKHQLFAPFTPEQAPGLREVFLNGLPYTHLTDNFGSKLKTYDSGRAATSKHHHTGWITLSQAPALPVFAVYIAAGFHSDDDDGRILYFGLS
ncbi:hypothetical protein FRB90_002018 [Tulasnella sp. 427]|nr:hypothetical protein FRB90_002018 [Tulasnella sp. 427]